MTRKSHLTTLLTVFSISTLLLVTLAGTVLAATNGSLETAQATIGFDGDTAVVTIDYTVVLPEEGNEMPIEVLVVEGTSIDEVTASDVSGKTQPVNLEDSGLGKFVGTIQLDAQGSNETSQVVVSYRVKGALTTDGSGGDVNIPIITTTWPPAQAVPGVFVSDMTLPAGYNYVDSFPSAPELIESQSDIVVRHNLQVLPAFVNARLTSGNAPLFNFPQKIVFGTGVVIAIALIVGFSKYKKSN